MRKMTPIKRHSKAVKLVELAEQRVPKAVHAVLLVGNLAEYNPTDEQAEAICETIRSAVETMIVRFRKNSTTGFRLPRTA